MEQLNRTNLNDKIVFVLFTIIYLYCVDISPIVYACFNLVFAFLLLKNGLMNDLRKASNLFNIFFFMFCIVGLSFYNFIFFNTVLIGYISVSFVLFQLVFIFFYEENIINTSTDFKKTKTKSKLLVKIWLLAFIFLGYLCIILYYLKLGYIPLFGGLSPEERIKALQGSGVLLQFIRFGIYASIIYFFLTKYRFFTLCVFFSLNLGILGTGFRGEFIQYIFFFFLCYITINNIKLSLIKLLLLGGSTLFFIVILEYFRTSENSDFLFFLLSNLGLSLSVGIYNFNFILLNFDNFQWGSTFFYNFSMFMPGPNFDYTVWLTKQVNMDFDGGITPTIIGDFYVNFSNYLYPIVILFAFFIKKVENRIINNQYSIFKVIFWVNISLLLSRSVTGGFSNQSLQLFITSFFILTLFVVKNIKINYENNIST